MIKNILDTDRLLLQEVTLKDNVFIYTLLNSPNWIQHIGDRGINTLEDANEYISTYLQNSYSKNNFGLYKMVLKEQDIPIGLCGFLQRDYLDHPDIGFAILPEYEKRGYTYEASAAVIEYSKLHLNISTVYAITDEKNINSQHLLLKIGLHFLKNITQNDEKILLYSN